MATSSKTYDWRAMVMQEDPPPIKTKQYEFSNGRVFEARTETSGIYAEDEND
jgi:hypothetical protein